MTAAGPYEVVVPTYNVARTIGQTLESLLRQTLPPARIIVADDASPDDSADVARGYSGVDVLHYEHSGLSGVQNRALAEVEAPFVAFVDADDVWQPGTGQALVDALDATGAGAAAVGRVSFRDGQEPHFAPAGTPVWERCPSEELVRWNYLTKSGTMLRTDALRQVSGWREHLPTCGDHDLYLRILDAGFEAYVSDWPGMGLRLSPTSMSRQPAGTLTEALEVALPRLPDSRSGWTSPRRSHARRLWFRALARAAHDRRDLRDVPALRTLTSATPPGQRALDLAAHSPLRVALAAGWRARGVR